MWETTLDPGVRRDVEVARVMGGGSGDDGVGLLGESLERDPDQLRVVLELGRGRDEDDRALLGGQALRLRGRRLPQCRADEPYVRRPFAWVFEGFRRELD